MTFFTIKQTFAIVSNLSCYLITVIILYLTTKLLPADGLLNSFFNFSSMLFDRVGPLLNRLNEKDLALNFLCNIRNLNYKDKIAFENSGLIHLLAISGSQISPITNGLTLIISKLFYILFSKQKSPFLLMQKIYFLKLLISNITSFLISSFFGWSGALIRVVAINYFVKIRIFQDLYVIVFNIFPYLFFSTLTKCFTVLIFSFLFGNLTFNISFLLSFIGALTLSIAYRITKKININQLYLYFINTILTTFFINILLLPFSNTHIFYSCLANILAVPLVCFFITPLTFLILVLPQDWELLFYILNAFDYCLAIFKHISIIFSNNIFTTPNSGSSYKIFSDFGIVYLNIIFIILSLINDIFKEQRVITTRRKFNSIKIC